MKMKQERVEWYGAAGASGVILPPLMNVLVWCCSGEKIHYAMEGTLPPATDNFDYTIQTRRKCCREMSEIMRNRCNHTSIFFSLVGGLFISTDLLHPEHSLNILGTFSEHSLNILSWCIACIQRFRYCRTSQRSAIQPLSTSLTYIFSPQSYSGEKMDL